MGTTDGYSGLGQLLLDERFRRNWSQERCAQHFGVSQSTWSRWQHGDGPPDDMIPEIAEWLAISEREALAIKYHTDGAEQALTLAKLRADFDRMASEQERLTKIVRELLAAVRGMPNRPSDEAAKPVLMRSVSAL